MSVCCVCKHWKYYCSYAEETNIVVQQWNVCHFCDTVELISPICWCCLDRGPGSFDVEDATTLSWSSAAVSEWVSELNWSVVTRCFVSSLFSWISDLQFDQLHSLLAYFLIACAITCFIVVWCFNPGLPSRPWTAPDLSASRFIFISFFL